MTGFLAQDVEAAAESIHYDFSGVVKPQNDHDLYSLRYSDFVVPLVKAVQELAQQNDSLKQQNTAQQNINAGLEQRLAKLEAMMNMQQSTTSNQSQTINISSASIDQNAPNPFNSNTIIRYYLPSQISNAQIVITNADGASVKTITLSNKGAGQVNITAGTLSSGSYFYSLLVDGKKVDTKQMILAK
ncbi:MAG: FlgD immunoglobulin-like domain containing protein [Parafilimonas sp.]